MYRIPSLVYNTVRSVLFVSSSKQILGCLRGLHSQVFAVRIWSSSSHTTKLAQISYRYWLIFNQRNSTVTGVGIEPVTPSTVVCWIYHCATASQFVFFKWSIIFFYFQFSGLDGSTTSHERERYIKIFNKKTNNDARIFLLSTRFVEFHVKTNSCVCIIWTFPPKKTVKSYHEACQGRIIKAVRF